jgi:IS30 family transposase
LEDAQQQAERYQKEKEQEEEKQSKLIEQIRTQSEEVKKSEDIIKQAKMSLTVMDED